jgi:integrase
LAAFAALICYTGLRTREIAELRWIDVILLGEEESYEIRVRRRGRSVTLPVVGDCSAEIMRWRFESAGRESPYVFPSRVKGTSICYLPAQNRLRNLYEFSGIPRATRSDLEAALARTLSDRGLSDHQIRVYLGKRRVASIDGLLRRYEALEAQDSVQNAINLAWLFALDEPGSK